MSRSKGKGESFMDGFSLRLRKSASDTDKAEFSMNAWLEAQDVQDALDSHSCSTDSHLIFMTREHLFK